MQPIDAPPPRPVPVAGLFLAFGIALGGAALYGLAASRAFR